jgi:hypothetical protein
LAGKPFALLGINSDADRNALKQLLQDENITWPSWWDGGGTSGPIATRWQLTTWPTIYILDADGVVRYKDTDGGSVDMESIEKTVDALLTELAAKSDQPRRK